MRISPNEMSFAQTPIALTLDSLGQRYGLRPSSLMDIDQGSSDSILMDLAIMSAAARAENERAPTTARGQVMGRRQGWNPEVLREIEEENRRDGNTGS
jgi:hypothetical protein